jgi:hypothetical protein
MTLSAIDELPPENFGALRCRDYRKQKRPGRRFFRPSERP